MLKVPREQSELSAWGGWSARAPKHPHTGRPADKSGGRHSVAKATENPAHVCVESNAVEKLPPRDHIAETFMSGHTQGKGTFPIVDVHIEHTRDSAQNACLAHVRVGWGGPRT